MEIYVRVQEDGCGQTAWYNEDVHESYLMDGKELWAEGYNGDYLRGTAFKNAAKAKAAARKAKQLMEYDGATGKIKATFWRFVKGELVETKFTKDGKIKR